jgi:hypothetical protein
MRKLGLLQAHSDIELVNFDHYIKLFTEGMSEPHAQMISHIFMEHVPAPALIESPECMEE